jgi:hypothetical protein
MVKPNDDQGLPEAADSAAENNDALIRRVAWFARGESENTSPPRLRMSRLVAQDRTALEDNFYAAVEGRLEPRRIPGTSIYEVTHRGKKGPEWLFYSVCLRFETAVGLNVGGGPLGNNKQADLKTAVAYQQEHEKIADRLEADLLDDEKLGQRLERDLAFGDENRLAYTLHALFCLAGQPQPREEVDRNAKRILDWSNNRRVTFSHEEISLLNAWLEPTGIDLSNGSDEEPEEDSLLSPHGIEFVREAILGR